MTTATNITTHAVLGPIVADGDLTFTAGEALDKFDLVYLSAVNTVMKTTGAAGVQAIGICDRAYVNGDTHVSVLLLGKARVLHMRAAGATTIGGRAMAVADGEVDDFIVTADAANAADATIVGTFLTAAVSANDIVQVLA